jgi:hypothetical protein
MKRVLLFGGILVDAGGLRRAGPLAEGKDIKVGPPLQHRPGNLVYDQSPPAGGQHNPIWQNCGFCDEPVRDENAVHSLEHGAVWITYQPDLPQKQIGKLRDLAQNNTLVLASPYPDPARRAATRAARPCSPEQVLHPRLLQPLLAILFAPRVEVVRVVHDRSPFLIGVRCPTSRGQVGTLVGRSKEAGKDGGGQHVPKDLHVVRPHLLLSFLLGRPLERAASCLAYGYYRKDGALAGC